MNKIKLSCFLLLCCIDVSAQKKISGIDQPGGYKNRWKKPPSHIPNDVSIDAPLMGNGDVTMRATKGIVCAIIYLKMIFGACGHKLMVYQVFYLKVSRYFGEAVSCFLRTLKG
jgi:hypothetical protein